MLRNIIIQRFLDDKVIKTIWHDFSVHIGWVFWLVIKLWILYFIYFLTKWFINVEYLEYIKMWVWIIWTVILIKYCIDFLNLYLDALTFTKRGITLFNWENVLKHKMDEFERKHIQVVSSEQNTIIDKIFNRGDMHFALTNNFEFPFTKIKNPQKTIRTIYLYKDKFTSQQNYHQQQEQDEHQKEKFNMLVETLWEVVSEYMEKKWWVRSEE